MINYDMTPADEVSLYDFLRSAKRIVKAFWSRKWMFICCGLVGLIVGVIIQMRSEEKYNAVLTMMLSDDRGQSLSGISSMLGELGLPLSGSKYNIDKLVKVAQSRAVIEPVLFDKVVLQGNDDYWINHFITIHQLDEEWEENHPELSDFRFNQHNINAFGLMENRALKKAYQLIAGTESRRGMYNLDYGSTDYILSSTFKSLSDTLSYFFVNNHFRSLDEFYLSQANTRQLEALQIIRSKRDSTRHAWQQIENRIAQYSDSGLGSYSTIDTKRLERLRTEATILKAALGRAEESLAIAELTFQNSEPIIQLLDKPLLPLEPQRASLVRYGLFGLIIGFIMVLIYFVIDVIRKL